MTTRNLWWAGAVLAGALFAGGCGGTDDPYEAMKGGDYAAAVQLFDKRIAESKPVEDAWLKASVGRIEALAHTDRAKAKSEAGALVATHGQALGERKVGTVAGALRDGGAFTEALELLNETVKLWPDSVTLDAVHSQTFADAMSKASKGDLDKLKGLGYAGGGESKFVPRQGSQTPKEKFPQG